MEMENGRRLHNQKTPNHISTLLSLYVAHPIIQTYIHLNEQSNLSLGPCGFQRILKSRKRVSIEGIPSARLKKVSILHHRNEEIVMESQ